MRELNQQRTVLKGGLTVVTSRMPGMASVSVGLWNRVGSRNESEHTHGISHFIEHLLFKGTRTRSAKQISLEIEGIGGYLNAFTSEESTCYYAKGPKKRFGALLGVLLDMYLNSVFDQVELEKERQVIYEELAMCQDQPQQHVHELLNSILWPNHPLGRCITGSPESLGRIRRSDLIKFFKSSYGRSNTVIAVAGDIAHATVVKRLREFEKRFGKDVRSKPKSVKNARWEPRCVALNKRVEQTQVAIGVRACSRNDSRRYPLRILNVLLGENMSSHLFQLLREDNGLAYNIYSSVSLFEDVGCLTIAAGLDPANVRKSLRLIRQALDHFINRKPSASEIRMARDYLIGQMELSLENSESRMMWLGEQEINHERAATLGEVRDELHKTKPADVHAAAQTFLQSQNINLALIGPVRNENALLKELLRSEN